MIKHSLLFLILVLFSNNSYSASYNSQANAFAACGEIIPSRYCYTSVDDGGTFYKAKEVENGQWVWQTEKYYYVPGGWECEAPAVADPNTGECIAPTCDDGSPAPGGDLGQCLTVDERKCAESGGTAITTDSSTICQCPSGTNNVGGECAATSECEPGQTPVTDQSGNFSFCLGNPDTCPDGSPLVNGECPAPTCDLGQHYDNYTQACQDDNFKPPECEEDFSLQGGLCIRDPDLCPDGSVAGTGGACLAPPDCPSGQPMVDGKCIQTAECSDGSSPDYAGNCNTDDNTNCPAGSQEDKFGNCISASSCPDGSSPDLNGNCLNTDDTGDDNCPDGSPKINGQCYDIATCPDGSIKVGNECITPKVCSDGSPMVNGKCSNPLACPDGSSPVNGECEVAPNLCPDGKPPVDGKCTVANQCPDGSPMVNGKCTSETSCPSGSTKNASGVCEGTADGEEGSAKPGSRECSMPPVCQGDPIHCAQLMQDWILHCEATSDDKTGGFKRTNEGIEYEKTDLNYTDVFTNFTNGVQNSAIISQASDFFVVNVSGSCPIYSASIPYVNFTMTFDHLCVPPMSTMWPLIKAIVLATASFLAFRWAFL